MRKTFRFLSGCAIAALMLGGLASCEDDPIVDDGNKVATTDVDQWMAVTVSAPKSNPFGRAANYENGSYKESIINSMHFFFFNDKGEPAASMKEVKNLGEQLNSNNVTKIASVVVKVSSSQGANLPTQTICFINLTNDQAKDLQGLSIDDIRNEVVNSFANDNNFIMSNSVYFGPSPLTGNTERICATPVVGKLFDTETEATNAIKGNGKPIVDIYVERLAAKIGLNLEAKNIEGYELVYGNNPMNNGAYNKVTLKFTPEYWFVNAVSKQEYITKRYGTSKDNMKPSYQQIADAFVTDGAGMMSADKNTHLWNDPTLYRSYWGCSPSYYTATYPSIAEDYNDTYPIRYYSYNDIKNSTATDISKIAIQTTDGSFSYDAGTTSSNTGDDGKITITGTDASGCLYVPETTTTINAIRSGSNNAATVASAVIVGKYSYTIGDDNTEHEVGKDDAFFIDTNRRVEIDVTADGTTTKETRGVFYTNTTAALTAFAKLQDVVYSDDQGTRCEDASKFVFVHPSGVAARLFALQIPTGDNLPTGLYYYDGGYKTITKDNVDAVNARLIQSPGYINKYDNGHAMFTIPIHHLGWDINVVKTGENAKPLIDNNGAYLWKNMRIGDLGIVRNHVYVINVKSIGGLGTAIIDNQPIVPPVDYVEQWLAVKLNVLSWRAVPPQNVDL